MTSLNPVFTVEKQVSEPFIIHQGLSKKEAAEKVVEYGIIPAAPIAKKAIPNCNIVLETGESMKKLVSAMLDTLYQANPASVGGTLPDEAFYYVP